MLAALPLQGVKILDLSRYLPGPYCTQILADFGAEVIKVEDVLGGDLGRGLPPMFGDTSSRFYTVNRNKKSISLDLKKEQGKEIFKRLVKDADIVVDQFRPGVMDKLGIGYDVLKEINERLIYCCITGYGLNGPLRDAAGHDLNYLNFAGITGLTGSVIGKVPAMSGVQFADIAGGSLYSVIAILLALQGRAVTGKGQLCEVAMMDGALSLLTYTLGEWSGNGILPKIGEGILGGGYACYQIYEAKDGQFVSLGAVENKFWAGFCQKLNFPEDYIRWQWKESVQEEILKVVRETMLTKTRDEWVEFFADSDICFSPVLNVEEVCNHPQTKARQMIDRIENVNNSGKDMVVTGVPVKLSETPGVPVYEFAALGQHNDEILTAAGYTAEELAAFRTEGVIG